MIKLKLNDLLTRKGVTLYLLAQATGIPHVTLWKLSQKDTQRNINLSVLSRICAALQCRPNDLLAYEPDAEDEAIAALMQAKVKKAKAAKKGEGK